MTYGNRGFSLQWRFILILLLVIEFAQAAISKRVSCSIGSCTNSYGECVACEIGSTGLVGSHGIDAVSPSTLPSSGPTVSPSVVPSSGSTFSPSVVPSIYPAGVVIPHQCYQAENYICSESIVVDGYDKLRCSDGANYNSACQGGFFDSEYNSSQSQVIKGYSVPCCPGYFCSRTTACMQPCSAGAFCIISQNISGYCGVFEGKGSYSFPNATGYCGGALVNFACPGGTYCPTLTTIESCGDRNYCPAGSTEELKCTGIFSAEGQYDYCGENESTDRTKGSSFFYAVIIVVGFLSVQMFLSEKLKFFKFVDDQNLIEKLNATDSFLKLDKTEIVAIVIQDVEVLRGKRIDFSLFLEKTEDKNITINHGLTAIIGLSGVGKSTLLYTLAGTMDNYYKLDATVSVNAHNNENDMVISNYDYRTQFFTKYGNRIAYVPQDDNTMHQPLTVWETVYFNARLRTSFSSSECSLLTQYWLMKLDLLRDDYIKLTTEISGGMKKRVNVAMELVTNPLILVLDEPTSGLDTKTTEIILTALRTFADGKVFELDCINRGRGKVEFPTRIVLAVIHQPSFEVSTTFSYIIGVQKIKKNIGFFENEPVTWSELHMKYRKDNISVNNLNMQQRECHVKYSLNQDDSYSNDENNANQINFMDTYVLKLGDTDVLKPPTHNKISIPEKDLWWCCETRPYFPRFNQIFVGFHRGLTLFSRNYFQFAIIIILSLGIGFVLGEVTGTLEIEKVPSTVFLLLLVTSLVCMQTGFQLRQSNQAAYQRERSRGVHSISIFLADTVVDFLTWLLIAPVCFLLVFYSYANPRGGFAMYYGVLLTVAFTASGFGQLVSELGAPGSLGIYINLLSAVLCGFSPPKSQLSGWWKLSFLSYPFEALVNGEYLYYSDVFKTSIQLVLSDVLQQCTKQINGVDAVPVIVGECVVGYDYKKRAGLLAICATFGLVARGTVLILQIWKPSGVVEKIFFFFSRLCPASSSPFSSPPAVNDTNYKLNLIHEMR
eukprot:gene4460-6307_t